MYRNSEGYSSPTEGTALAHITHEERVAARKERLAHAKYVLAWINPKPYVELQAEHKPHKARRRST